VAGVVHVLVGLNRSIDTAANVLLDPLKKKKKKEHVEE
jgi:hypothetical protein